MPALRWAAANGERTIVSTNTINLQEQLVGKDLPFLARAFTDQKVRFALLKGWRNYLCLARLEQARASGSSLFEDGVQRRARHHLRLGPPHQRRIGGRPRHAAVARGLG